MRIPTPVFVVGAAATLLFAAGCSSGGALVSSPHQTAQLPTAIGAARSINPFAPKLDSFYACPATGLLAYLSDYNNNVVNVYAGKFNHQAPCGRLTATLNAPWGMYVDPNTHDLYVANDGARDIAVFHRGKLTPYNKYIDPTHQDPVDVAVAKDGTVLATNLVEINLLWNGSISTWRGGPHGGQYVGNFRTKNNGFALWITIMRNGDVYYNDLVGDINVGTVWTMKCPAGACGPQSQLPGVTLSPPGGLASDDAGDLLANSAQGFGATFELPNLNPTTFRIIGTPVGLGLDRYDHHWFVADPIKDNAAEYDYPSGKFIGSVPGNPGGNPQGVAVDP